MAGMGEGGPRSGTRVIFFYFNLNKNSFLFLPSLISLPLATFSNSALSIKSRNERFHAGGLFDKAGHFHHLFSPGRGPGLLHAPLLHAAGRSGAALGSFALCREEGLHSRSSVPFGANPKVRAMPKGDWG